MQDVDTPGDMFTCEKFHTRMLEIICVRRQTEGVRCSDYTNTKIIPDGCRDCEQGNLIRARAAGDNKKEKEGVYGETNTEDN